MATKFLFEDNEDSPISILLKNSYKGNDIYFSSGCSKLLSKAKSIQSSNDVIYIFYDMSPNYKKTVNGYNNIIDGIKLNKLKDIHVIPIICIEYIALKMLYQYGCLVGSTGIEYNIKLEYLVKQFDWQALIASNIKLDIYFLESLEHAYKNILVSPRYRCQHNKHDYDKNGNKLNKISGVFYEKDCNCERKFCPINCTDSLKLKAERLYTQLPLFTAEPKNHEPYIRSLGIQIITKTTQQIQNDIQLFYNEICKSMSISNVQIHSIS